jgi:hypothetical protein
MAIILDVNLALVFNDSYKHYANDTFSQIFSIE